MATKKKAPVKAVKKSVPVKKAVASKKPVAKKESAPAKTAKVSASKEVKPASNKAAVKPGTKSTAKPAPKPPVKAVAKTVNKSIKKVDLKKEAPKKKEEKKADVKKQEVKKATPKVEVAKAPAKKAEPKKSETKSEPVAKPVAKKAAPKPAPKPAKVVIPEMKTKTVRKYEPEFTRSVLDKAEVEPQVGPTMRYSDAELVEFRELIGKKYDQAKKELGYLQGLITRKDEMGGGENESRYMTMEDGSMSMEREQLSQMASRQINYIDHLEKALIRIENKTYGICRVTGKLIDKARLRAVPHATLSIEAKQTMNK